MPDRPDSSRAEALAPRAAARGVAVLVVGMHRSGTSAVNGMLTQLGLNPPRADDLLAPSRWNERGNGESRSLVHFNDRLLGELGGSWSAPPELLSGWESDVPATRLASEGLDAFAATAGTWPFAWKDPRNCVLMPFWTSVVGPPVAAVFVYREPLEVARSLQARDGFSITHGLALWERYVRTAAANLAGVPTIAVEFADMLSDPTAWCHQLVGFLATVDVSIDPALVERAAGSSERRLVHQRAAQDDGVALVEGPRAVLATLQTMQGAHFPWKPPDLGGEPSWVADVFSLRRELELVRRDREAARSPGLGPLARTAGRTGIRLSRQVLSRFTASSRPRVSPPQSSSTSAP